MDIAVACAWRISPRPCLIRLYHGLEALLAFPPNLIDARAFDNIDLGAYVER